MKQRENGTLCVLVVLAFIVATGVTFAAASLHEEAGAGHLDIVKALIAAGADVNAKDKHGKTSLQRAADMGHLDVVKFLKAKGAKED